MKLSELRASLAAAPERNVCFQLPDGARIPAHAHVTEIARIDKQFVDCGGTFRTQSFCRMQTWVSDDLHHRLTAGTLLKILSKASSFLQTEDIEVDVEHQLAHITQFPLEAATTDEGEITLRLAERRTECLAPDQCKRPPSILDQPNPLRFQFAR